MRNIFISFSFLLTVSESFNPFRGIRGVIKKNVYNFKRKNFISIYDPNILDKLRSYSDDKYTIIDRKNSIIYNNLTSFLENNRELDSYKTISISPGGLQGYYLMGVIDFLKKNYILENYLYTGASAGAWSCLLMSFRGNDEEIIYDILKEINSTEFNSIFEMQLFLKEMILKKYTVDDFDFSRTFIGVTVLKRLDIRTNLFYNFESLEDAIDCCIASSHIPFLTGGLVNKYNNEISFDGGFSSYPYLDINNTILHINPNIWSKRTHSIIDINDLINDINETNFHKLYEDGYNDTEQNKNELDDIFKYN